MIFTPLIHASPSTTLEVSKKALAILEKKTPKFPKLLPADESPELWFTHEYLILACLRTGNEKAAYTCLQRLIERFGVDNQRMMALAGLYTEAMAEDDENLTKTLQEYDLILQKDPTNTLLLKRRVVLLKSLGRPVEAILALNKLLDSSPNDAEAWAELSDLYVAQGMYEQAVFALEEVLLITPYAWNIYARLGEVLCMSSSVSNSGKGRLLVDSLKSFCRSVELCHDYLRGYLGLKLVTNQLQGLLRAGILNSEPKLPYTDQMIERLSEFATTKLTEICRKGTLNEGYLQGYSMIEITKAMEVLNAESTVQTASC